jgi:hypothetical protein
LITHLKVLAGFFGRITRITLNNLDIEPITKSGGCWTTDASVVAAIRARSQSAQHPVPKAFGSVYPES